MNKKQTLLVVGLGLALASFGADALPTVYVSDVSRTIVLEGGTVVLDSAYCFDAWPNGEKPSSETERAANYAQWGTYASWNADFVITFDRPVAAGSVVLYGQIAAVDESWVPLMIKNLLASGDRYFLLQEGFSQTASYLVIAEAVGRIKCGVKNLSSANIGTTMTVELRLSDPNSSATETLAMKTCTFRAEKTPNWFDAKIASYRSWPIDAAKAFRGAWRAIDGLLEDSAQVNTDGVLSIDTKELDFVLGHPRKLGVSSSRMTVSADVSFGVYDFDRIPTIDPQWKGAVIRVAESEGEAYYGLAQDGVSNVWRRLEGPAPTDGMVIFLMELRSRAAKPVVNYTINGFDYKLNGEKNIPIVASDAVSSVVFGGEGALTSLAGATESGLSMQLK